MPTFVLKVNAHPATPAFPENSLEWEAMQFFGPAPRAIIGSAEKPVNPKVNDRVHIWFNETGGGGGYTGYGEILGSSVHVSGGENPTCEFRLTKAKLLPSPISGEHFWKHSETAEAISSIRRYTLRQLLWMNISQSVHFDAALRSIALERFGRDAENFI